MHKRERECSLFTCLRSVCQWISSFILSLFFVFIFLFPPTPLPFMFVLLFHWIQWEIIENSCLQRQVKDHFSCRKSRLSLSIFPIEFVLIFYGISQRIYESFILISSNGLISGLNSISKLSFLIEDEVIHDLIEVIWSHHYFVCNKAIYVLTYQRLNTI